MEATSQESRGIGHIIHRSSELARRNLTERNPGSHGRSTSRQTNSEDEPDDSTAWKFKSSNWIVSLKKTGVLELELAGCVSRRIAELRLPFRETWFASHEARAQVDFLNVCELRRRFDTLPQG